MDNLKKPLASGYDQAGASQTRRALRAFIPNSGPPHEDIDRNNGTLRERARMLYMSTPLATSALKTNRTHIVGPGLTLQAAVDREILGLSEEAARAWQHKTEAEFHLWADSAANCDALGMDSFDDLQQLALLSWLMSGDVFALIRHEDPTPLNPYGLRLLLVEADRVCNPDSNGSSVFSSVMQIPEGKPGAGHRVFDGVEVDKGGKVIAYHVCNTYPRYAFYDNEKAEWTRILARGAKTDLPNILHIRASERPGQYRGVPYLAPVIETLLQQRRYTESELMSAVIQSFFTAWIKTETEPSALPIAEVGDGEGGESAGGLSTDENEYEMGPGTVTHLKPGEDITFGAPNIPTAGFEMFTKTLAKLVGSALELPYDVLVKEFNSSYSASRGALMEAWEAFKMVRHWFVGDFTQPVYELWLSEAVARGRIKAPGFLTDPLIRKAWCSANWIGPVQVALDPNREAQAAVTMTSQGFKSHKQVTRELGGGDWDQNVELLKLANEKLREAGAMPPENNGADYEEDTDDTED